MKFTLTNYSEYRRETTAREVLWFFYCFSLKALLLIPFNVLTFAFYWDHSQLIHDTLQLSLRIFLSQGRLHTKLQFKKFFQSSLAFYT